MTDILPSLITLSSFFYLIHFHVHGPSHRNYQVKSFRAIRPVHIYRSHPWPYRKSTPIFHPAYQHTSTNTFPKIHPVCQHKLTCFSFLTFTPYSLTQIRFYFLDETRLSYRFVAFIFIVFIFYCHCWGFAVLILTCYFFRIVSFSVWSALTTLFTSEVFVYPKEGLKCVWPCFLFFTTHKWAISVKPNLRKFWVP